jgi:hypothetical protein
MVRAVRTLTPRDVRPPGVLPSAAAAGCEVACGRAATDTSPVASLREDLDGAASWIAEALRSSGYLADFSPVSLWSIDRFFDEHSKRGKPRRGGLLSNDLGSRVFALGAYTGEVIRRQLGGEWRCDEDDPRGEINVELALPDGGTIWPIQRVMKRLSNGAEDGIAAYGAALGLDVGRQPPTSPTPRDHRH